MDVTATVQRLAKIDYLDGLGLAVGAQEVSFVHVAKRFFRISLRHAWTVPLPESGRERMDAFGRALTQFLDSIEVTPDQVVLCLPRRAACVSRLMVPETARGSLSQVIDYEVERLLPFPKEEIYYDSLTYEAGGEERRLGVAVCCLPRRVVDEYLEVLTHAQVRPQTVTLSNAALLSTVAFCGSLPEVPSVLVALEGGEVGLSFIEKKRLIASHLFPLAQVREQADFSELLAQGVARHLPGISPAEIPIFAWGTNGSLPLSVGPERQLAALVTTCFPAAGEHPLPSAALPALGAALQAVGEDAVRINLLPLEKRARREKRLSPLTLVLAGLIVVLGAIWAVGVVAQEHRILRTLAQQREALEPAVRQVQTQEEETERLRGQLQVLNEATQKRVAPLLKNLSDLIPADVYLTSFRYKGGDVELSGVAARPPSELVGLLEGAPCLHSVTPKAPFTKTAQGETFTLGAQGDQCN
ncbi:MAG: PilN domain-containing protein [Candidatus Binatia bacterium]